MRYDFLPGDNVRVRPWTEISAQLDAQGMCDRLPFMEEMIQYCGKNFVVSKRMERTCEEIEGGMRRIERVLFLSDLRCDGSKHGGCDKGCRLFWKTDWVAKTDALDVTTESLSTLPVANFSFQHSSQNGEYICQSTELLSATKAIPIYDVGVYLRDIRARTFSVSQLIRILIHAIYLRFRSKFGKTSYRVLRGRRTETPVEMLCLQPGELVEIKSESEIKATLDKGGKNRGLAFTVEMLPFCGKRFRVLKPLRKMINERTRKLVNIENTVILEDVTCDGCHILRGGCARDNYHFWREIWLRRVTSQQ